MKTAQILSFDSVTISSNEFTFTYYIDGKEKQIKLSHSSPSNLEANAIETIGFNIGMCYLLDIAEIVLPKRIDIFTQLSSQQLTFWSELFKNLAIEKMYALGGDIKDLDIQWESSQSGKTFKPFSVPTQNNSVALCLTGGKESLALLKMLEKKEELLLFYLNLERSVHRQKVFEKFQNKFRSVHTISNRVAVINALKQEYSGLFSGVDMAHLFFNTMLYSDSCKSVLIGNEYSSNFPNAIYQGYVVNHQFVKTIDFARRLNAYAHRYVTNDFTYYSPFFSLYEYRISEILFKDTNYLDVWTSCNQATETVNFCSNCHKCAFTYLVSRVRVDKEFLDTFFSRDLLDDVELFKPLMDFVGKKPLDCVGDKTEVWVALDALIKMGLKTKVTEYFQQNILPQIKDELDSYIKIVNAKQVVPQVLPENIESHLQEALGN